MKKYYYLLALTMGLTFTACSSDSSNGNGNGNGDNGSTIVNDAKYKDVTYGVQAMSACDGVITQLNAASNLIVSSNLNEAQETYLYDVLNNLVDYVIVPTYTKLADETEDLEKTLNGLTVSSITQDQIDKACADFKEARAWWEKSEAFLGGAASDFNVDPTIDSWPLNRSLLLSYFNNGMNDDMLDDATILGFHALEFILFRNGQPRKVAELKSNDTYKGFEKVTGAQELKYAQTICTLLKERCYQLQVAWEGETTANAARVAVIKEAGLEYTTSKGLSYGDNMKQAGKSNQSTFATLEDAIVQVLNHDEGSCVAICDEVGSMKIGNPFANGDVSYVESPYSYNSIIDFQNNIRSIQNVWLGNVNGVQTSVKSFHNFFASAEAQNVNTAVEGAVDTAISNIGKMPSPFVKYVCTLWNIEFTDDEDWEVEE